MRGFATLASFACALIVPLTARASPNAQFFAGVGNRALASGVAPGVAIAVVSRDRIVYESGFGFADRQPRLPASANTRFAIGSLTKQLTAAAIALLAHRAKLSFDDPLSKYAPSLPNAKKITLRMLLDQTSGLHNYPNTNEHQWQLHGPINLSAILSVIATDKPDFAPGTRWAYSNTNYTALAMVVEKAAGVSLGEFLARQIFTPLQMTQSGFGYRSQSGIATGYVGNTAEVPPVSLDLFSGAGGAVSSAHDLALWDRALLLGTLLPRDYLQWIWSQGVPTGEAAERYAMGWVLTTYEGHRELWHNGLAPQVGGYCYNAIFPDDALAVVVLTNGFGGQGVPERVTQQIAAAYGIGRIASANTEPTPAPNDNPAVDALARRFWNQLATADIDRANLTPQFSAALTPALLAQVRQGIATLGELRSFTFAGTRESGGVTAYRYLLVFASGAVHEWDVAITTDGKIAGSRLVQ